MKSVFSEISIFGRVAYAIYSIEEYLFEIGESKDKWEILLSELWSFSKEQYVDDYLCHITEFMPSCVTEFDVYDSPSDWEYLSEDRYYQLYSLYTSFDDIETVDFVMDKIQSMISAHIYSNVIPPALVSLQIMENELIPFLKKKLKKLLDVEPFRIFSIYKDGCWDMAHNKEEIIFQNERIIK